MIDAFGLAFVSFVQTTTRPLKCLRSNLIILPLGLIIICQFPQDCAGSSVWHSGLWGAAPTVLPSVSQTPPQTSPLLTPKDCFVAPALPLHPIALLLMSFSSCILGSDSGSPFKAEFPCRRLLLSATPGPHALIVVLFTQSYYLLSSLLSLFGFSPGG